MKNISRMNVLESSQNLVKKITNVIVAEVLGLEQLVEISLHERLYNVTIGNVKEGGRIIIALVTVESL